MPNDQFPTTEPPCIGLDPDTAPCPFCGAAMSDPCGSATAQRQGCPNEGSAESHRVSDRPLFSELLWT